jgi:hypothetical protein
MRVVFWLLLTLLAGCAADCDPELPRFARILDGGRPDGGASSEEGGRDAGDAGEQPDAGN